MTINTNPLFNQIRQWADARNLLDPSRIDKQMLKLGEEYGELCAALARNQVENAYDAIGDMVVVLTILAAQLEHYTLEEALQSVYVTIKDRTGKTKNGVFVKDGEGFENDDY